METCGAFLVLHMGRRNKFMGDHLEHQKISSGSDKHSLLSYQSLESEVVQVVNLGT